MPGCAPNGQSDGVCKVPGRETCGCGAAAQACTTAGTSCLMPSCCDHQGLCVTDSERQAVCSGLMASHFRAAHPTPVPTDRTNGARLPRGQALRDADDVLAGDAQLLHDLGAGRRDAETIDADGCAVQAAVGAHVHVTVASIEMRRRQVRGRTSSRCCADWRSKRANDGRLTTRVPGPRLSAAASACWSSLPADSRIEIQRRGFLLGDVAALERAFPAGL